MIAWWGLLSFRKIYFPFSNLSLKSLTQPRCPVSRRWFKFHKPIADVAPSSLHSVLGWVSNSTSLLWSTWNLPLDALICAFWWWVSKKGSIFLLQKLYWSCNGCVGWWWGREWWWCCWFNLLFFVLVIDLGLLVWFLISLFWVFFFFFFKIVLGFDFVLV